VGTIGADWYRRAAHPVKTQVPKKNKISDLFVHMKSAPNGRKIDARQKSEAMLFGGVS